MTWTRESDNNFAFKHITHPAGLTLVAGQVEYGYQDERYGFPLPLEAGHAAADYRQSCLTVAGLRLAVEVAFDLGQHVRVSGTLKNNAAHSVCLERLTLATELNLGGVGGRLSFFKNGYQSWTETRAYSSPTERAKVPRLPFLNVLQDNARNLSSQEPGCFNADMFAVVGNLDQNLYMLVGQSRSCGQFVCLQAQLDPHERAHPRLSLVYDFGGKQLPPGGQVALDEVVFILDSHANRVQESYFDLIRLESAAARPLPTGWCSWYYYFARVAERDLVENIEVAHAHQVNWQFFVLDDGYQAAIGDWLALNDKFPSGLEALAGRVRAAGMQPGVWMAPFIARSEARLFRDHPDWLLRDAQGRPALAGRNPTWGPFWKQGAAFYGLDTTHPGFQDYLRELITTFVHQWGYRYLKLDFTYAASLYGMAYDPCLSPAERLALGYRIIREAAGPDVFILGCGSPLSPARGYVDAMRIGPDVAPYWFANYRYHLTRDPHALCVKFAIRSILNRCQMHRMVWINDPDCLLLRGVDTRLSPDERLALVNAAIITGGMVVLSDRLADLPPDVWGQIAEIERLARACDHGRPWALDYMEREIPELVYNSSGYLAVFNTGDQPVRKCISLVTYLEGIIDQGTRFQDAWNSQSFALSDGLLDLGEMPPHASRLLKWA